MRYKTWVGAALAGLLCQVVPAPALAISVADEGPVAESYALETAGDYQAALKSMTSVLRRSGDDYFVHLRLGWLFALAKKAKNASYHYAYAARLAPTSSEPLLGLSLVYFNAGDFAAAAKASESLLTLDPRNYTGHIRLIGARLKQKDYASALSRIAVANEFYAGDAVLLEQKGFALMQLGRVDEGKRALAELLVVSPANSYARSVLGRAH